MTMSLMVSTMPRSSAAAPEARDVASPSPGAIRIPSAWGEVTDAWQPASGRARGLVVYVQDIHAHPEAQRHLAELIGYLRDAVGIRLVAVEGAAGPCDTAIFSNGPDAARRQQLARIFLEHDLFTGPEYYAVTHPDRIALWGIEDGDLYQRHLAAYRRHAARSARVRETGLLGQLQSLRLTPREWARLQEGASEPAHALPAHLADAAEYYRLAQQRDRALAGHALERLLGSEDPRAILVAGGFHTPGITARLRAEGIAYLVVTPRTTTPLDRRRYAAGLRDELPPLAAVLWYVADRAALQRSLSTAATPKRRAVLAYWRTALGFAALLALVRRMGVAGVIAAVVLIAPVFAACAPAPSPELSSTSTAAPSPAATAAFAEDFNTDGILEETGRMEESANPNWWVNSGGRLIIAGGVGRTLHGELPEGDRWRRAYAAPRSNPADTDQGRRPQNIFRLVARNMWRDFEQSVAVRIAQVNLSSSPGRDASDGVLLFNRYVDGDHLYYAGLRVDGTGVIKKKAGSIEDYHTLAQAAVFADGKAYHRDQRPNALPVGRWFGVKSAIRTLSDGAVRIQLWVDRDRSGRWELVTEATDAGENGGPPILADGHAGIRTDFMDAEFDDYQAKELR